MLKVIWKDRDVLICEEEQTMLGVGSDLFDEAKSIRRIIFPQENAFDKYEETMLRLKKENKEVLIILALGPISTVLAYDLAKERISIIRSRKF